MKIRIKLIILCFTMLCLLSCASQLSLDPPLSTDNWKVGALYSEIAAFLKGEKKYQELSPEAEKLYLKFKSEILIVKELLKSEKISGEQVMEYLMRIKDSNENTQVKKKIINDTTLKIEGKVVNINYGVPFDMFLKVNDEKDVAIAKRDATIAEKDAVITKLIEENKEREKLSNLETKKSINNEVDKTTLKERLIGIGTSLNTVTNKDNISQILLEQKKVEKLNSFDDWYENGAGEFNNGNYPAAITSFTKALETVQNEASKAYTYNYRGTAYFKLRKFEKSLADYNKAIDLKILGHELPYYNKGIINYICLGQYEEAKINLNKSIVANPKHIDSYLFLSAINIIEGDYESALDTVDKSFSSRNKAYSFQLKTEDAAMLFYIKCLAMKLLNKDTSYSETELNKILKTDFIISRKFDFFTSWLKDADFNNKTMAFIKNKNELFKQKQQTSYP